MNKDLKKERGQVKRETDNGGGLRLISNPE